MRLSRSLGLLALVSTFSYIAHASTIGSYATGAGNFGNVNTAMNYAGFNTSPVLSSGTASTFTLSPNGVWENPPANSTWVGYLPTAGPLSGVDPPFGYYTFTTTFSELTAWSGSINVEADDTTEVFLDGSLITTFGSLGGDGLCADSIPNCTLSDNINISGAAGPQTLSFLVRQAGQGPPTDDPSGVAFAGTVNAVPEPGSLVLLGTGLIGSLAFFKRKSGM